MNLRKRRINRIRNEIALIVASNDDTKLKGRDGKPQQKRLRTPRKVYLPTIYLQIVVSRAVIHSYLMAHNLFVTKIA
jgi:hypothetical protein